MCMTSKVWRHFWWACSREAMNDLHESDSKQPCACMQSYTIATNYIRLDKQARANGLAGSYHEHKKKRTTLPRERPQCKYPWHKNADTLCRVLELRNSLNALSQAGWYFQSRRITMPQMPFDIFEKLAAFSLWVKERKGYSSYRSQFFHEITQGRRMHRQWYWRKKVLIRYQNKKHTLFIDRRNEWQSWKASY